MMSRKREKVARLFLDLFWNAKHPIHSDARCCSLDENRGIKLNERDNFFYLIAIKIVLPCHLTDDFRARLTLSLWYTFASTSRALIVIRQKLCSRSNMRYSKKIIIRIELPNFSTVGNDRSSQKCRDSVYEIIRKVMYT